MESPRTSAFAAARLPAGPALASGGFPGADVFRFYRADRSFRRKEIALVLWTVIQAVFLGLPRHPWFFRFTDEGRIPSGRCPSPIAPTLVSLHFGKPVFLSCTRWSRLSTGEATKFASSRSRMFLFQGFPQPPFSPAYWPPGYRFGGGFPHL